jgi:hypothetical protein
MKNKKIILISALVLIFVGILFLIPKLISREEKISIESAPSNLNMVATEQNTSTKGVATTLQINGVSFQDEITEKTSVDDFMNKLQKEGKINFTEKYYLAMGELITSINGVANNNSQSWIYYVDGKEAQVGISNYKINPGDVVSWKYEKSNY